MNKTIVIIMGEPNSIFSEILFKVWIKRKKHNFLPFVVIGNIKLLKKQMKFFNFNIKIKEVTTSFSNFDLIDNFIPVINVKYNQNEAFKKITSKSNKFIFKSFDLALELIKRKKVFGLINGPVSKETLLKNKFNGVTEYLSYKTKSLDKEVMLIFNTKLSVSPITTHIPLNGVSKSLTIKNIFYKANLISKFYKKYFKKKICLAISGLNPHCYSACKNNEENKIIIPAVKRLKKKIKVEGPLPADTLFLKKNIKRFDVVIGMYHDQVLVPMKTIFELNAINITLGLPFLRVSPDHGVGTGIIGKKIAKPDSLIECLNFFKKIK